MQYDRLIAVVDDSSGDEEKTNAKRKKGRPSISKSISKTKPQVEVEVIEVDKVEEVNAEAAREAADRMKKQYRLYRPPTDRFAPFDEAYWCKLYAENELGIKAVPDKGKRPCEIRT